MSNQIVHVYEGCKDCILCYLARYFTGIIFLIKTCVYVYVCVCVCVCAKARVCVFV